jgi:hypothetical protein
MKVTRVLLVACLAGVFSACATPKYNYSPEVIAISEPPIGTVSIARIGDTMLKQGKYKEHAALFVPTKRDVTWAYEVHPGYYLMSGQDEKAEYYVPESGSAGGHVEKAVLADPWKSVMARKNKPELCVVTILNAVVCKPVNDLQRLKRPILADDAFQRTLIYNGRVGSKINIAYREFSNSLARPAFNNEVEYDLNESKVIGYKGAELEVLEATNQHIKFRLIRNFNDGI